MIYEITSEGLKEYVSIFDNLQRGDVIHWGGNYGYPAEDKVIIEKVISYGRVTYRCINLQRHISEEYTPHFSTVEAHFIKSPDDSTLRHRQYYFITRKILSEEEIKKVIDFIPIAEARNKKAEEDNIKAIHDTGQLTQQEKSRFSTTEISKLVKQKLKDKFPKCKFSIRTQYYSGGSSISVSLMEANFKVFKDYSEISEKAKSFYSDNYSEEQLKALSTKRYAQLNQYTTKEEYDADKWNNGHFLTEQAHNVLREVCNIVNYYNYDNSDSQTDYYDVNFSFHLEIGRYDKPLIEVV
jgi:hypothetical protein